MSPSRRDLHTSDTRAAIVRFARSRFGRNGYSKTTLEAIATDANVTIGAVYHHFGNKARLFDEVFERTEADLLEISDAAVRNSGHRNVIDILMTAFEAYLVAVENPTIQRIVFVDAPAVLGTKRCDEVFDRYGRSGLRSELHRTERYGIEVIGGVETATRLIFGALVAAGNQPLPPKPLRSAQRAASLTALRSLLGALVKPSKPDSKVASVTGTT